MAAPEEFVTFEPLTVVAHRKAVAIEFIGIHPREIVAFLEVADIGHPGHFDLQAFARRGVRGRDVIAEVPIRNGALMERRAARQAIVEQR